jgi:hypothetical protein
MQANDSTYLLVPQKDNQSFLNVDNFNDTNTKPSKVPLIISIIIVIIVIIIMIMNERNNKVSLLHTRWNLIGTLVKSIGIMIAIFLLFRRGQQSWVISLLCVDLFPLILFRDTSLYHIL